MTRTLIFDTETTGLPTKRNVSALEDNKVWPNLVSISWHVYENDGFVKQETHIIKPQGWNIPEESIKFHKITEEIAFEKGEDLKTILDIFKEDLKGCTKIIAHNLEFDKNVMFHAYKWRLHEDPLKFWDSKKELCTCNYSKNELKLPSTSKYKNAKDPYKYPGLDELYRDTFKEEPPANAHSADRDVDVLAKICWRRWRNVLLE